MLIGLHGKAQSGKDTSYRYIEEWALKQSLPVRRDAFADRLKLSLVKSLGFEGNDPTCMVMADQLKQPGWEVIVRQPDGIEHPLSGRAFIQCYGDEGHRQVFGRDFWIGFVLGDYPRSAEDVLVVTDVRYRNEADAIKWWGGEVWEIVRPGHQLLAEDDHASEASLPSVCIDRVLVNAGDRHDLRAMVHAQLNLEAFA
jgi:hypothetical protein